MTAAHLLPLAINVSMALMVFSVALSADVAHFRSALQKPGLLARSLFAMYVVMPLVAILIAASFEFSHALKAALVLLALSPVPPLLPKRQIKVGGSESYVLGLLVAAALAAIVVVPAGVTLIGRAFGQDLDVPFGVTTKVVARSVLLPLVAGLIVARLAPRFAKKGAKPIGIASVALLVASLLPVVFAARHLLFAQIGNFTILAIVLFALLGIIAGHLLGGPDSGDRKALALAVATRHPGVALAILHVLAPGDKRITAIVLLYLLVSGVVAVPYLAWRKRAQAAPGVS